MNPLGLPGGIGARTLAPIRSGSRPVDRAIIERARDRVSQSSSDRAESNLVSLRTFSHNQNPLVRLSNAFRGNSHGIRTPPRALPDSSRDDDQMGRVPNSRPGDDGRSVPLAEPTRTGDLRITFCFGRINDFCRSRLQPAIFASPSASAGSMAASRSQFPLAINASRFASAGSPAGAGSYTGHRLIPSRAAHRLNPWVSRWRSTHHVLLRPNQ